MKIPPPSKRWGWWERGRGRDGEMQGERHKSKLRLSSLYPVWLIDSLVGLKMPILRATTRIHRR